MTPTSRTDPYILVATVPAGDEAALLGALDTAGVHPEWQERRMFLSKAILSYDIYVVESEVARAMRVISART